MKFEKPGEKIKPAKIHNAPRLHKVNIPSKKHCRFCGLSSDTVAMRHYEGMFKHKYGKGTGIKCHDKMTALLCADCDKQLSGTHPKFINHCDETMYLLEKEVDWLMAIIDTHLID